MTTVEYSDDWGDVNVLQEVYRIPEGTTKKDIGELHSPFLDISSANEGSFPHEVMVEHERKMITELEAKQFQVLSVKSELISKRRYKRRAAKELKRLAKRM